MTGAVFVFPPEAPLPERPRSDGVTYVNIPVSPTSKKQLNYMELELQEPGPGTRGTVAHPPSQSKSSKISFKKLNYVNSSLLYSDIDYVEQSGSQTPPVEKNLLLLIYHFKRFTTENSDLKNAHWNKTKLPN